MADESLHFSSMHMSLGKPDLLMGCERKPLILSAMIPVSFVMGFDLFAAIAGGVLWVVLVAILRQIAKADPVMSKVYPRHIKYNVFYPAHSTPFARSATHKR